MSDTTYEQQYPAVELAYPIAINAYDFGVKRLDVMDARIQTIGAFAVTVSAAFVSVAASQKTPLTGWWLVIAGVCFILLVALSIFARLFGSGQLLDVEHLYSDHLHETLWEFKKNIVYASGLALNANMRLVEQRWWFSVWISLLFVVELVCLVAWVVLSKP
jgi:hypothetical protein